ncbi:MAG: cytidylate kinase [Nitrospinae bacterium CG11_big_fil_rev_8_21_14_0_20_56_8]|nr:MAG: cytidylate kinase [Nitrospinae bacterium CG11_big_fil_rev_8_21_14_0_20_56_8]
MIIAIDGPAGSGKSTVAKIIALKLNFRYIDTGAMYRTVALKAQCAGVDLADEVAVARVAEEITVDLVPQPGGQRVVADGEDVTDRLKDEAVGRGAAVVAAQKKIRELLTAKQRELGRNGHVVMDGRDIGTVVFPDAEYKFFLDADPEERGRRRYLELKEKNMDVELNTIVDQVRQRDHEDRNRAISPLRPAENGIIVDTTHHSVDEVVEKMLSIIRIQ